MESGIRFQLAPLPSLKCFGRSGRIGITSIFLGDSSYKELVRSYGGNRPTRSYSLSNNLSSTMHIQIPFDSEREETNDLGSNAKAHEG